MDPERITATVGISPSRQWKVGEPRVLPNGKPLPGVNEKSYWSVKLHEQDKLNSEKILLEEFLLSSCKRFANLQGFFQEVTDSGGQVEFFVGWFGPSMFGASFEPKLLRAAADLNTSIELDIYAGEDDDT